MLMHFMQHLLDPMMIGEKYISREWMNTRKFIFLYSDQLSV